MNENSRLDRAIDRAVRNMVHVDPRPGFRGRVFARLEAAPARRAAWPQLTMAAGALALVLLAVFVAARASRWNAGGERVQHAAPAAQHAERTIAPSAPPTVAAPHAPARAPHVQRERTSRAAARSTREPIPLPRITNVFGTPSNGAAAASVPDTDAVWPAALPDARGEHANPIPPLVIPPIESPAPIVIAPLIPRGPK